jgi:hypothetical protein
MDKRARFRQRKTSAFASWRVWIRHALLAACWWLGAVATDLPDLTHLTDLPNAAAQAPRVSITMSAEPSAVRLGETLVLQIDADAQGAPIHDLELPDLTGFEILQQQESRPMRFQVGAGQRAFSVQASLHKTLVLRATRAGKLVVPAARLRLAGKTYSSGAVTIHVFDDSSGSATDPNTASPPGNGATTTTANLPLPDGAIDAYSFDRRAFLRVIADKSSAYVGEQITVSVYLYTSEPLRTLPIISKEATKDGFWVHDLLPPTRSIDASDEVVQKEVFQAVLLQRFAAFALHDGKLEIGPITTTFTTGSLFFGSGGRYERTSPPLRLHIQPLPPVPDGHTGEPVHVGDLRAHLELEPSSIETGDATTLRLTLQGDGNLALLTPKLPPLHSSLRVTPATSKNDLQLRGYQLGGRLVVEWILIADAPGNYTVAPLRFQVLDPHTGRYATVETPSLALPVTPPVQSPSSVNSSDPDSSAHGPASHTSATPSPMGRLGRPFLTFLFLLLAAAIAWAAHAFRTRRQNLLATHTSPSPLGGEDPAPRTARVPSEIGPRGPRAWNWHLNAAEAALHHDHDPKFWQELGLATRELVAAITKQPVATADRERLRAWLNARPAAPPECVALCAVMDAIQECRYSGITVELAQKQQLLEQLRTEAIKIARRPPP